MKAMKKSLSVVLALIMVLSVIVIVLTVANAGSYVQMFNIYGHISDYNNCRDTEFSLSSKTTVKFTFSSAYGYCSGFYRLEVESDSGKTVLSETGYLDGDDVSYSLTLAAGTYYVYVYNNDDSEEESELSYDLYGYRYYNPPKNPTKLKLNKKSISICKDAEYTLKATYSPSDVTSKIKFTSSNKSVASVSTSGQYGYVKGKRLGVATITAKMGNKKAKCTVVVKRTYVQMKSGKSKNLLNLVKKVSGYKKAKWSSGKKSVVTVDKKGKIKAKKHGIAKITAKIKGRKYTITVYSYSHAGVKKRLITYLKDHLIAPQSLKVGRVTYPAYNSCRIWFSAYNRYGERVYDDIYGEMKQDVMWITW